MKEKAAKHLLEKVQKDYLAIAKEFSETRKWLWPDFKWFEKYLKDGLEVIDLGCGNGRFYEFLKSYKNIKYTGIDSNPRFIEIAQNNYSSTKFVVGNLLNIPYPSEADILFSIASLHHIPSQTLRNKSIQEIKRVLKKDGILVVTAWNIFQKRYRKYLIKSLFKYIVQLGKYDWNDTFIPWGKTGIMRYYHAFTPGELKKLFKNNGFEILEMFYTRKGYKTTFLKSHNICVVCRKK